MRQRLIEFAQKATEFLKQIHLTAIYSITSKNVFLLTRWYNGCDTALSIVRVPVGKPIPLRFVQLTVTQTAIS